MKIEFNIPDMIDELDLNYSKELQQVRICIHKTHKEQRFKEWFTLSIMGATSKGVIDDYLKTACHRLTKAVKYFNYEGKKKGLFGLW